MTDSRRKGDRGEREAIALIREQLGFELKRLRTPGEAADCGDLVGLPDTTVEVKWRDSFDPHAWLRQTTAAQARNGHTFGACFVRRPGKRWIVLMTPEQFAALWREATAPRPEPTWTGQWLTWEEAAEVVKGITGETS